MISEHFVMVPSCRTWDGDQSHDAHHVENRQHRQPHSLRHKLSCGLRTIRTQGQLIFNQVLACTDTRILSHTDFVAMARGC